MLSGRDEGPVYYREIQKNAYLKRIPDETTGSKLRPLGHKKPVLKAMWTLFCVHNGRTPFLEQYPEPESPATLTHKPTWRACLKTARHVTASVKPHVGEEYDFLVDTDHGPVRMLAPDWDSMQDWVTTLRSKLQELKILGGGENVYAAPPVAPLPRAPARDPTSPLPPTPPVPPDRVPGIELNTPLIRPTISEIIQPTENTQNTPSTQNSSPHTQNSSPHTQNTQHTSQIQNTQNTSPTQNTQNTSYTQSTQNNIVEQISTESQESIDISSWDCPFSSLPSTSQERNEPKKSVAKICGQNVCVDDSVLKRDTSVNDSDEEFFAEIDRISNDDNLGSDVNGNVRNEQTIMSGYKQRVVVNKVNQAGTSHRVADVASQPQGTNITVIQVSNKGPPHTAIPILGSENVFDFSFKQNLEIDSENDEKSFVNIVNTEVDIQNTTENGYGTVFSNDESTYGHLSLTTTVNLIGNNDNLSENNINLTDNDVHLTNNSVNLTSNVKVTQNDAIYERLCMASTSNKENSSSPLPMKRLMFREKSRKSSLPNLESESAYECLFPNANSSQVNERNTSNIQILNTSTQNNRNSVRSRQINSEVNMRVTEVNTEENEVNATVTNVNTRVTEANLRIMDSNDYNTRINDSNNRENDPSTRGNIVSTRVNEANTRVSEVNTRLNEVNTRVNEVITQVNLNQPHLFSFSTNIDSNTRVLRSNIERSHSQNAYDIAPRLRENLIRRVQNNSPKRDGKNGKIEANQTKPIWKRGLTELSLLSRLRGIGQGRRQESPTRQENDANDRAVTSPVKVVRRSRPEVRVDNTRRRSNSLSNGDNPGSARQGLQSLRQRQAAALRGEQLRGAAIPATIPVREPPLFAEYNSQLWVAWWGIGGSRCGGRAGDRVAALRGTPVKESQHARQLIKSAHTHIVDILFHRVPLGKIYVLHKRDHENLGIKLDSECVITSVEPGSPAGRAGLTPTGKWALSEVNNRPLNLIKGGEEEMNRLSMHGSEVSVLIQPAALVKKLRAAIKANKPLLSIRRPKSR